MGKAGREELKKADFWKRWLCSTNAWVKRAPIKLDEHKELFGRIAQQSNHTAGSAAFIEVVFFFFFFSSPIFIFSFYFLSIHTQTRVLSICFTSVPAATDRCLDSSLELKGPIKWSFSRFFFIPVVEFLARVVGNRLKGFA